MRQGNLQREREKERIYLQGSIGESESGRRRTWLVFFSLSLPGFVFTEMPTHVADLAIFVQ